MKNSTFLKLRKMTIDKLILIVCDYTTNILWFVSRMAPQSLTFGGLVRKVPLGVWLGRIYSPPGSPLIPASWPSRPEQIFPRPDHHTAFALESVWGWISHNWIPDTLHTVDVRSFISAIEKPHRAFTLHFLPVWLQTDSSTSSFGQQNHLKCRVFFPLIKPPRI